MFSANKFKKWVTEFLSCSVLYCIKDNMYFLQTIMPPKNIHVYTPSFCWQTLTLESVKVSALLSPPAASGSKGDSLQYSYTHEKTNIYDLSPELKYAPLFGNTSVCHENSYGKLHLIANDNMHCMPRYHSKTDFPIWYVMD